MILLALTVTTFVADTNALNTSPVSTAAGKLRATASPTAAPVTAMVRSAAVALVIEPKFNVAVALSALVIVEPSPKINPAIDLIGPENVVRPIFDFSLHTR